MPSFANALWAGAEIIEQKHQDNNHSVKLKLLGNNTANDLFKAILPVCEIVRFNEVIPTMNDIFISTVQTPQ